MNKKLSAISYQLSASSSCAPGVPPCSGRRPRRPFAQRNLKLQTAGGDAGRYASRSHRVAFSLAELMIAITILGIGLLVVAAVFPIAWGKARDLAEHATSSTCTETAEITVKLLARVDSATDGRNFTSFAGDYLVETATTSGLEGWDNPAPMLPHDTRVHALTLQNLLTVTEAGSSPLVTNEGWRLIDAVSNEYYDLNKPEDPERDYSGDNDGTPIVQQWYGPRKDEEDEPDYHPQVRFHERMYPSVDPYPDPQTADPEDIDAWNARLDTRRYCWSVFHRLNERLNEDVPDDVAEPGFFAARRLAAGQPRMFTMYYVTLCRTRGQRFARQDAFELGRDPPEIRALEHDAGNEPTDVKFPSPWLVPIRMPEVASDNRQLNCRVDDPDRNDDDDVAPRGVPTDVLVELEEGRGDDFREFFAPGTQFIDSVSGAVYRVVKRRLNDEEFDDDRFDHEQSAKLEAMLTLDREIFLEELQDLVLDIETGHDTRGSPEDERWVWVFPPAIERIDLDEWLVDGPSPVVAIDVRSLVIRPQ